MSRSAVSLAAGRMVPHLLGVALGAAAGGCAGPGDRGPVAVRLVDVFDAAVVEGTSGSPAPPPERTEWRFDAGAAGWQAGRGVAGLRVSDGLLSGRSSGDFPILHVERSSGLDDPDLLHEVEVRLRASAGTNLAVDFTRSEELDLDGILANSDFPWALRAPLVADGELRSYTLSPNSAPFQPSFPSSGIRHVLLRPTDAAGAEFEIESIRLVFRREHLAAIPAGVSWQGFGGIFRETIVTRSPERARFELTLPDRPRLELAVATVEAAPVTFRVELAGGSGEPELLVERTVTTAHRWEPVAVDLAQVGGGRATLTLSLAAEGAGALGFWGAPALRGRGARIARASGAADLAAALGARENVAPRGVIVILADTLRRDRLDAYGHDRETAPTLTRLAAEGTLFRDAIAQGAWTKVSAPSLLTSLYPTTLGIVDFTDRVPALAVTLGEVFREAGYATWASSSVPFTGRLANLHQGIEVLHERQSLDLPEGQASSKTARAFADRMLDWLDERRDVPFFAFLHAMDAHDPYRPYPPYDTLWAEPGADAEHERRVEAVREKIRSPFMKRRGLPLRGELLEAGVDPEAFVRTELDWYDGSTRAMDAEVRRVIERLGELGLERDTLVVVASDHGEEFLDHGAHFHEMDLYGEMINVPLLLWWPGVVPAGAVVERTVQNVDVMPTVLELSGLPIPETVQGRSLLPLLAASAGRGGAGEWPRRPAISEWARRADQRKTGEGVDAYSIIDAGWKLVHYVQRPDGHAEFELFHHEQDPLDRHDLAADNPEVVERLARQLDAWREWAQAARLPSDDEAAASVSADELERLRSLGYVQ